MQMFFFPVLLCLIAVALYVRIYVSAYISVCACVDITSAPSFCGVLPSDRFVHPFICVVSYPFLATMTKTKVGFNPNKSTTLRTIFITLKYAT